jgi:mutator protein MutT
MSTVIVTAAIIVKASKILIAQRKDKGNERLKWEFPGGKLEEYDNGPKECLKREIMEELDIEIEIGDIFEVVYHKYEATNILLLCYIARYLSGEPKAIDCNDFRWIDIKDLDKYELANADIQIRNKLLKKGLPKF